MNVMSTMMGLRFLFYVLRDTDLTEDAYNVLSGRCVLQHILRLAGEHFVFPRSTSNISEEHLGLWLEKMVGLLWFSYQDTKNEPTSGLSFSFSSFLCFNIFFFFFFSSLFSFSSLLSFFYLLFTQ